MHHIILYDNKYSRICQDCLYINIYITSNNTRSVHALRLFLIINIKYIIFVIPNIKCPFIPHIIYYNKNNFFDNINMQYY